MSKLNRTSTVFLLCGLLVAPVCAAEIEESAANRPAIPPGQEKLLLEMLGNHAWLPEGCKLANGRVEYTVVEVKYECPWGNTVLEFAHVGTVESPDAETAQFAIKVSKGSAPVNLADVVAEYIRSQEDDFEWTWPGLETSQHVEGDAAD